MWYPNLTPFFRMFDGFLDYIYQLDEIFGIITFIIAMLISLYSFKIFNLTKRRNYFLFSASFYLIALGFLTRFIFDFLYETETLRKEIFLGTFELNYFQLALIFGYMFFLLAGYILLLITAMKTRKRVSLLIFIIAAAGLVSSMNYYITFTIILLIVISTLLIHFDRNFNRVRTLNAGLVWYSFLLILLGYVMQLMIFYSNKFYLLANGLNMLGFLMLLLNFILVLRK
ncbi:MAG: hypothetical protein ACOCQG_06000 [Candidatus Nanoarchaeia archaeon]